MSDAALGDLLVEVAEELVSTLVLELGLSTCSGLVDSFHALTLARSDDEVCLDVAPVCNSSVVFLGQLLSAPAGLHDADGGQFGLFD